MAIDVTDDMLRVLEVTGKSERGLTIHGITQQLNTHHRDTRPGRTWTDSEVRGIVTRLVRRGYLRREGTEVLRWYEVTSMGRGYLSEEVIKP